mgnify:CR=1 FL=1
MKNVAFLTGTILSCHVLAQNLDLDGKLSFNNRVGDDIQARVTFPDGTGVGAGFTAQLLAGPVGTPVVSLQPLLPVTNFRTKPESALEIGRAHV